MSTSLEIQIRRLTSIDLSHMASLSVTFGEAFDEIDTYTGKRPSSEYLRNLLNRDYFIALAAFKNGEVVGGVTAYELIKFEQARSEIYIYDLAISLPYRRKGIATDLIQELKQVAKERGAHVIFVQADVGDDPAIDLYAGLGACAEVLHFDIHVDTDDGGT